MPGGGIGAPAKAQGALAILGRTVTEPEFQPLARLTAGPGGRWSYRVAPRVGMVYEARFVGATSRVLGVGVRPTTTARIVSRGRVWAHVAAGRSLRGRLVKVQKLAGGTWHTLAKLPLDAHSVAVFPASMLPGGTSTLRIAMSVNQAGAGYLGTWSRPFVDQR